MTIYFIDTNNNYYIDPNNNYYITDSNLEPKVNLFPYKSYIYNNLYDKYNPYVYQNGNYKKIKCYIGTKK